MEPAFVCEFTPTVAMIAARIRKYSKARCAFFLILSIALFAYVLFNAIVSTMLVGFDIIWVRLLLFTLAVLLYFVFIPQINAFFAMRNYKKDNSGNSTYKIAFGEQIEVTRGTIKTTWEYSDICEVYHLKHSYELVKTKRLALIVDPNGFTKGSFDEFKQFLREKRPDLTVPE